ncbi:MAG: CooT family nickel-binding protein [Proteobacteria bacterium]|nr:CooT family nickel-binding protein [Pseudomonadota bacterium]
MCEAAAYLNKDGRDELILEAVDVIEPENGDAYRLVSIFGEQRIVKARIKSINLVNHRIVFEE